MNDIEIKRRDIRPALVFLSGELIAVPIPLEREEVILAAVSTSCPISIREMAPFSMVIGSR